MPDLKPKVTLMAARTASQDLGSKVKKTLMDKIVYGKGHQAYDDESTQMLSLESTSFLSSGSSPSKSASRSLSSDSTKSSSSSSSSSSTSSSPVYSQAGFSTLFTEETNGTEYTEEFSGILGSATDSLFDGDYDNDLSTCQEITSTGAMQSAPTSTATKLSLELDKVQTLIHRGRNFVLRRKSQLPPGVTTADIHVKIDVDPKLESGKFGETIRAIVQEDLESVYSADARSAKLSLCIVIVALSDGAFLRSLKTSDGVMGLAEMGVVWWLFDPDDLTVHNGGVVVKSQDVATMSTGPLDFLVPVGRRGRTHLMDTMAPCVANDIMLRIAESRVALRCEV
jgi:hypothetical protein